MIHHTAAVARARPDALIVGDMPWLSYHISIEETVRNAGRFLREGGAEAVKLEGGRKRLPMIEAILAAEIPVMGHLGLTPQSVNPMGGFRVQGKKVEAARELLADAHALANAGVFAIVLEGIPDLLAEAITREVDVPTIGIGAGPHCDGQVLVFHDVLGFHDVRLPRFVRQYAHLADIATEALQHFFSDIQSGKFPSDEESYHMDDATARAFRNEE
jgi:3-methyl-2-oxobutanoate hydroxymethyltransferase